MKYKKIKNIGQYNKYCDIHESLILKDDDKYIDKIELLEILIEDYDNRMINGKYKDLNPVELLRTLLVNANLSQVKFAKKIKVSPQLVSDILNYRRNISKELVTKISAFFSMAQEAFSRSYELNQNIETISEVEIIKEVSASKLTGRVWTL